MKPLQSKLMTPAVPVHRSFQDTKLFSIASADWDTLYIGLGYVG